MKRCSHAKNGFNRSVIARMVIMTSMKLKPIKKKHKYRGKYMVPSHTFQYGQSDEQINKAQIIKIYKNSNAFNASENKKKTLFDL